MTTFTFPYSVLLVQQIRPVLRWFLPQPRRCSDPSTRPIGRHREHGLGFRDMAGPSRGGPEWAPPSPPQQQMWTVQVFGALAGLHFPVFSVKDDQLFSADPKRTLYINQNGNLKHGSMYSVMCHIRTSWPTMTCL